MNAALAPSTPVEVKELRMPTINADMNIKPTVVTRVAAVVSNADHDRHGGNDYKPDYERIHELRGHIPPTHLLHLQEEGYAEK